jgi:hypothetical protein
MSTSTVYPPAELFFLQTESLYGCLIVHASKQP